MVKRFHAPQAHVESPEGAFVRWADYLSLQAALREALELVERWVPDESGTMERLEEIQKQFLDI